MWHHQTGPVPQCNPNPWCHIRILQYQKNIRKSLSKILTEWHFTNFFRTLSFHVIHSGQDWELRKAVILETIGSEWKPLLYIWKLIEKKKRRSRDVSFYIKFSVLEVGHTTSKNTNSDMQRPKSLLICHFQITKNYEQL